MKKSDIINEEEKLKQYIAEHNIEAEHLRFDECLHTVQDTIRVTGFPIDLVTKSMIFKDKEGKTIVGMVPAEFRVSSSRLGKILNCDSPELCEPEEAYERTGYPVGGMPCFGFNAIVVVDPLIMHKQFIYTGGGSEYSLVRIAVSEIIRVTAPIIKNRIRGKKSN